MAPNIFMVAPKLSSCYISRKENYNFFPSPVPIVFLFPALLSPLLLASAFLFVCPIVILPPLSSFSIT